MRLIDADALEELFREVIGSIAKRPEINGNLEHMIRASAMVVEMIKDAPTIEPQPRWIPCSERLPDDNDYKECMECLDGAVWYFTENGAMGLGYYYESTKEWATTDDLKTDGKVVAWMPLPSPCREEADQ